MKHPELAILQDYFENALAEKMVTRVKTHLENCDHCTKILAEMAMVESKVRTIPATAVSQNMEAKIFREAAELLKNRREYKQFASDWKENIFPEIRIPALQLASVSIMLATFIAVEKAQSLEETIYEPLSHEVKVYEGEDKA